MNARAISDKPHPWKRWLLIGGGIVCLAAWIGLIAGLALDVERGSLLLATAAALSTEALVWLAALTLGLKVFEARRVLIGRLKSLFGR